jgi:hypothetical protein
VIRAKLTDSGVVLTGDVPANSFAYIDADWVPRSRPGPVAVLVVERGMSVRWDADAMEVPLPEDLDPDAAAAVVLAAVAREACDAVSSVSPESIEVTGDGLIARQIRATLAAITPNDATAAGARPSAVIETTGDPDVIVAATCTLDDLGMLVLAGHPRARLDLDLYPDVHVRGLELVGIAGPLAAGPPWRGSGRSYDGKGFEPPRRVELGKPLPMGAAWYCVAASGGN